MTNYTVQNGQSVLNLNSTSISENLSILFTESYSSLSQTHSRLVVGSSGYTPLQSCSTQFYSPFNDRSLFRDSVLQSQYNSSEVTSREGVDFLIGIDSETGPVAGAIATSPETQRRVYDSLSWWDDLNPTRPNSYKDDYPLQVETNTQFQINMESYDFDTYLQILDSKTGNVIAFDDDSGDGTDSQLTFTAQAGTRYIVRATSYRSFAVGDYRLSADTLRSPTPPIDPVDPAPPNPPAPGQFDSTYGYGLVDASVAVARAINAAPFASVSDAGYSWSNNMVNAPEVWARGYTGRNVVVAVVDSGVDYRHSDLDGNIWVNTREIAGNGIDDDRNGYTDDVRGWDFIEEDSSPMDVDGHGTHVAGTIAAENNGFGITGVAYNARVMPVRVLDDEGSGSSSGVARGIRYAADNGANVINLSLGSDSPNAEVEAAVQYASSRGAIVVMAAGNSGFSEPGYPAAFATQWGLAVGAVDSDRMIADFSNLAGSDSQMRYVVAPGVAIDSTLPGNEYDSFDGTSMAAPHVAGVVALMLSANPNLTDRQVRDIITGTAA